MNAPRSFGALDYGAALGVVVIWGLNFVAMKFALKDFTAFQLGAARFFAAAFPLVFLVRRPKLAWGWFLLYGLCQGVGQFALLFTALRVGMTASLASVLMQTQVFFTAIFSFVLLGERPGPSLVAGLGLAALALGCFGVAAVSGTTGDVTLAGLGLNLGGAAFWGASNVVARKAQQSSAASGGYDPFAFVVWASAVPVVPFLLLSAVLDPPASAGHFRDVAWTSWAGVLYLGWLATIAGYALWTGLLMRHPANRVAPFSLAVPVVGLVAGVEVLHEHISAWQWAGIVLVMAALASIFLPRRKTG
jgi:O-acetylserine/cysteine efflux transporter